MRKQKNSLILIAIFLSMFFIIMALGYSKSYKPGYFPDELAHMGYVSDVINGNFPDFRDGFIFSTNKLNYLNHPALYYIVTGELVKFLHAHDAFADVGRYVNMLISILIIILTCKMLHRTTRSISATFSGTAFLLVIPMFVVSGSAVSNDQINVLGCTLVVYGLIGLLEAGEDSRSPGLQIFFICVGGVIAALSKATGSLAIVCLFFSVAIFNFKSVLLIIKTINFKQWLFIVSSIAIVIFYFVSVHIVYGKFYPAPQGNPVVWFFVENPHAARLSLSDFLMGFLEGNFVTLTTPYGHVHIIDSETRLAVLQTILIMLAAMTGYVVVKKNTKNDGHFNLTFSFVLAFFLFFFVYFLAIRQMHLNAGYPGALQARYFFGFLPVFSLVIAKVVSWLKGKAFKAGVLVLMLLGLATSTYPALLKLTDLRVLLSSAFVEQPLSDTNYGFLTKGRTFEQTILAESSSLDGAELKLATFARINHGSLDLALVDESGKTIASNVVNMETIKDNSFVWFDFRHIKLIKNQKYRLRLKCDDCSENNAITWWALKKDLEAPIFLLSKFGPAAQNLYPQGEAYVSGVPVGGSFTFRLYF